MKPQDIDTSILHNLQQQSGSQLLQAFQQNLAKQEADRQLHDIQQVLKQEAESQATNTTTQQVKKQPISQEEMEKHLIQKLFLQASGGIPATDAVLSLQVEYNCTKVVHFTDSFCYMNNVNSN